MDTILYTIGAPLFLISLIAYLYIKKRLRPKADSAAEDYYYEFEDQSPEWVRYTKWSRITFASACIGALLLFIAFAI